MILEGKEYSEKADAGKKLLECTQLLKSMEVKEAIAGTLESAIDH